MIAIENEVSETIARLRFAKSYLAFVKAAIPLGLMYEPLCLHAQQAAIEAIKAVLIYAGIDFFRKRIIGSLIKLLPSDLPYLDYFDIAPNLRAFKADISYPTDKGIVDEKEFRETLQIAEAIVAWADAIINPPAKKE